MIATLALTRLVRPSSMLRPLNLLKPVPLLAALSLGLAADSDGHQESTNLATDVSMALRDRGISTEPEAIHWIDPMPDLFASWWSRPRALVLAKRPEEHSDVWLVRARVSPEGRLLRITALHNLTHTSAVDEDRLTVRGEHAAWTINDTRKTYRLELADLAGEPIPGHWPRLSRAQAALTNWQRTGSLRGVRRRSFKLDPPAHEIELELDDARWNLQADGRRVHIPFDASLAVAGGRFVLEQERVAAEPGSLVTWAVDRVRDVPWFGDERMQLVKAVAFRGLDLADRALGRIQRDDSAERIAEELGSIATATDLSFSDPETGWPPAPMSPFFGEPLEREGKWLVLDDDPFVAKNPGLPAPIVRSFIRTDEDRIFSRIFVALWDPRQVDLHLVPGTEEPQSATGETGSGLIPRDPKLLTRLVAAFNGGFQSTHGDYGMMVEGRALVPPKPYAATVALLQEGTTGFGTWPEDVVVPANVVAFRQNLTPLVADGQLNPYRRTWWGGVPQDWEDETRTVRSGLCLTTEGFIAYFYGSKVDHEHLGLAMQSARCAYGLHLDMNQGHTGLEFYRVDQTDRLPPIERRLDSMWEAQGAVRGLDGYRFRSRRLIRTMQLMHFPRYIGRGQRDFFFLTLRHLLPGSDVRSLGGAESNEGKWTVTGLPQHGWPYAVAVTSLRPDPKRQETKVRLLRLDPKFVQVATPEAPHLILTMGQPTEEPSSQSLWHGDRRFWMAASSPRRSAARVIAGATVPPIGTRAAMAICEDGMLAYAEVATAVDPRRDAGLLDRLLHRMGCDGTRLYFCGSVVALAGARDLSGHPARVAPGSVGVVRRHEGETVRLFANTPILPPSEWTDLQRQRRFFPREKVQPATAESG